MSIDKSKGKEVKERIDWLSAMRKSNADCLSLSLSLKSMFLFLCKIKQKNGGAGKSRVVSLLTDGKKNDGIVIVSGSANEEKFFSE